MTLGIKLNERGYHEKGTERNMRVLKSKKEQSEKVLVWYLIKEARRDQ